LRGLVGAAAWPIAARAQQGDRVRRVGVLEPGVENDPGGKAQLSGFTQRLGELGLDRWPQPADRLSLAAGNAGLDTDVREGVGQPPSRRDPRAHDSGDRRTPAGDADDPDRIFGRRRSGR